MVEKADVIVKGMAVSPYRLGGKYLTVGGEVVRLEQVTNFDTSYQTMACRMGVHRYTARDFGRVTGTDHNNPDPRNLRYPPVEIV